ncbi:MAG TPA: hypothetical protein VHE54_19115 [Puia sp.]|nr:hypothetical protein [Puia sp.]
MKYLAFLFAGGILFGACGHSEQSAAPVQQDSADVSNPFFPVTDYLEAEILSVDSTPTALIKYVTHKGRTDSSFISVPEFNSLALQFLPPPIRDSHWERHFTETSFSDKATRSVTFTYSPRDPGSEVQRVDVLTTPGRTAQEVRTIYIEQNRRAGDSVILRKMLWKSKVGFQIVTLTRVKGQQADEQQLKVVWGSEQEDE